MKLYWNTKSLLTGAEVIFSITRCIDCIIVVNNWPPTSFLVTILIGTPGSWQLGPSLTNCLTLNLVTNVLFTDRRCPPLPAVDNSKPDEEYVTDIGSKVTLSCYKGHRYPDGTLSKTVTCLENGQWDWRDIPSCESECFIMKIENSYLVINRQDEVINGKCNFQNRKIKQTYHCCLLCKITSWNIYILDSLNCSTIEPCQNKPSRSFSQIVD